MGEIKSTLDLVMERTGHLSMSAEEKEAQRREDFLKRLQGLLQHYLDEGQTADSVLEHVAALQKEMDLADDQLAVAAVVGRIDPDQDNGPWLALLERLAPELCTPLRERLETHRRQRAQCLQAAQEALADQLVRQHGIGGSAVAPNPQKDTAARRELAALRDETRSAVYTLAEKVG